jgi:hypothetical protein
MDPVLALELCLVAVYLSECVHASPRGAAWLRVARGALRAGWARDGFALGGQAWTLGGFGGTALLVAAPWPLALSPEGLVGATLGGLATADRGDPSRVFAWDELRRVEADGRWLVVNDRRLVPTAGPRAARELRDLVRRLAELPRPRRAAALAEARRRSLDVAAARTELEALWPAVRGLRRLGALGLGLVALLLVLGFHLAAPPGFALATAGALILVLALGLRSFRAAYARLIPDGRPERNARSLALALSPLGLARAWHWLARDLAVTRHPLAVLAAAAPDDAALRAAAAPLLRDLLHPVALPVEADGLAARILDAHHAAEREAVAALLRGRGLGLESFDRAPEGLEAGVRSWCPRCHAGRTSAGGDCDDCPGIALRAR